MTRKVKSAREPALPVIDTARAAAAAEFLAGQEITLSLCGGCGAEVAGVNGRYSCHCGWVNHWSEGHRELPPMEPADTAAE